MVTTVVDVAIGVLASLSAGILIAVLTGKLVPASKVDAENRETEKWKASYRELKASADKQEKLIERLVLTADVTDKVLATLRAEAD